MNYNEGTNTGQLHYSFVSGDLPLGHVVVEHAAERAAAPKKQNAAASMTQGTTRKSRDLYNERYEKFVKLYEAKTSFADMAEQVGVSENTLHGDRYQKKYDSQHPQAS